VKKRTVLVLLAIVASPVHGQTRDDESLKGLKQVEVIIESIDPEAVAAGLDARKVRTEVVSRLQRARIKMPQTPEEIEKDDGILDVNLSLMRLPSMPAWAVAIEVQLSQPANLQRTNAYVLAPTWKTGKFGQVGSNQFRSAVLKLIGGCVDEFMLDYLAANQK
jgi:hypothetical protein